MELVTPHLKSVLKNYQHSATNSLHGPGTATLVQSSNKKDVRDEPLEIPTSIIQQPLALPLPPPFPIQQIPILTTPDTSRSERTETMLEGESISCFVVGGEKRLCLPQVLNSVLQEFSLHQINQECDRLQIYCSRCTPEQLNELKNTGILPSGAPSCGLITKTDAERLCSALLHSTTSISSIPLSKSGGALALSFRVYHECFGKCTGVCTPAWYAEFGGRCIECVECRGLFTPQQFVCHAHRPLENRTCHWGFDSGNWRAYLHVCRDESDRDKCARLLDALKERHDLPIVTVSVTTTAAAAASSASAVAAVSIEGNISNGLKRKQINLLEPDMLKTEPIEIPLKKSKIDDYAMKSKLEDYAVKSKLEDYAMKSKLDDYAVKAKLDDYAAAYLYAAATMDPIYIHAAMYEQWSTNRQFSAFRPVSNMFANNGKDTCKSEKPPRHQKYYKDQPPVLQNPERVVPLSESERFERSFQPNVALAPPLPAPPMKSNKHLGRHHHYDNYNHHQTKEKIIKIEEQEYNNSLIIDHQTENHNQIQIEKHLNVNVNVNENCPIKSNVISSIDESECLLDLNEKDTTTTTTTTTTTRPVDRNHSAIAIVDSTVSVVQSIQSIESIGVNMNNPSSASRYNSEIELSTDTDDSLSDMSSDNPRKVSPDIQRVMDGLASVPMETRDRVVDIVRRMVFEHNRAMQQSHEKDERIAHLEQRVLELEANLRQATGGATSVRSSHSEYDVTVTSSRTEMPTQDECIPSSINIISDPEDDIVNDSPSASGDMHIGSSSSSSCAPELVVALPIICSPQAQAQALVQVQVQVQETDDVQDKEEEEEEGIISRLEEAVSSETVVISSLLSNKTLQDSDESSNNSIGTENNEPE